MIQIALLQASFMLGLSVSHLFSSSSCSITLCFDQSRLTTASGGLNERGAEVASPSSQLMSAAAAAVGDSCRTSPMPAQILFGTVCHVVPGDVVSPPHSRPMDLNGADTAHMEEASIGRADTPTNGALNESSLSSSPLECSTDQAESVMKLSLQKKREYCLWLFLFVSLTTAIWLLIIVGSYSLTEGSKNIYTEMLRSVALAPSGAWLRYSLWHIPGVTSHFTSRLPHMKIPTLAANLVGTLLLSAAMTWEQGLYTSAFTVGEYTKEFLLYHTTD